MLPGINDSHGHLIPWATGRPPFTLDVGSQNVKSIADVQAAIAAKVAAVKPGEWIRGAGWDVADLGVADYSGLTRSLLDAVAPNNPVFLTEFSMHTTWVNSKALELAGITGSTPDPDGYIVVDGGGNPTGVLKESALSLVLSIIPPFTVDEIKAATVAAMKELNAIGITSVTDALVSEKELNVYKDIHRDGNQSVRVTMLSGSPENGFAPTLDEIKNNVAWLKALVWDDPAMLKMTGIKLFADGIPPTMTAWLREPYVGTDQCGSLVTAGATDEEKCANLNKIIAYANSQGCQIGVHAVGDRAIDATVDGFVAALEEHQWDARHYIIHGDFVPPATAKVMSEYRIGQAVQATIRWLIAAHMHYLVPEALVAYQCPLRTLFDAGVCVSGSSDMPIVSPNWKQGVQSAILRDAKNTEAFFGVAQRITREEAIRSYTINAARQDHQDTVKGSIEAGKVADFCVLADDILTIEPHKIADIKNDVTILNGKIVYQR
jgi:predicted amidohydrolase YtcJ